MRDRDTIDAELRRLAALRRAMREHGGELSSRQLDELLDERLGHRAAPSETAAADASEDEVVARLWSQLDGSDRITPRRAKRVLRRVGPLALLPLSVLAVAAVLVTLFAVHHQHPTAQPTQPTVVPPTVVPPPSAQPSPATPHASAPPLDIVDTAFIDALKHEGVPVPSREYVISHGHAVCDFLAHQPNLVEAVNFVQRTSVWDADQSANVAAGAIVSYCPNYQPAGPDEMQQTFQNALTDLQRIQGDLQGIRDDLQAIPGQQ
jgi:DNA-binding FrmR family transcriptional regulator